VLCALSPSAFSDGFTRAQDFHPPTAEEAGMKGADGAAAAVLDWQRYDDNVASNTAEYVRIKVFTADGKKYGDVEVPYIASYPYFGRVSDINARTIRPDGTIIPFDGKVYDKVIYKSGGDAVRAKTFSLADVQPGSILEYRFMLRWSESLLTTTFWDLQRDIPILHLKFTVKPYTSGDYSTYFTYLGLPSGKMPVKTADHFDLELDHMPAFMHEEFAPPDDQLKAHVGFYYVQGRLNQAGFWPGQAKDINKKVEKFIGRPNAVQDEATLAIAGAATPEEKARKLYARAQLLRNLSFGSIDTNARESRSAADVLKGGGGFRDEINRTFVALARAAGLEADVMRVSARNRFFFAANIPDADQMNADAAVVMLDGKPVYLDPGTPGAPFGVLSWEKTGVTAIHTSKNVAPEIGATPFDEPSKAVMDRKAALKIDGETLKGVITATFSGQEALVRRLRGDDDAARRKSLEDEVKGWLRNGASVKTKSVSGLTTTDDAIVASFDVELPDVVSQAGSRVAIPMSIFASAKNPFVPSTRTNPIYFEYARIERDEVKITLPDGFVVNSLPQASDVDAGSMTYKSAAKVIGKEVVFTRTLTIDTMLLEAQYYAALRKFFSAVARADESPLVGRPQ
jgi:hypothetical protein